MAADSPASQKLNTRLCSLYMAVEDMKGTEKKRPLVVARMDYVNYVHSCCGCSQKTRPPLVPRETSAWRLVTCFSSVTCKSKNICGS